MKIARLQPDHMRCSGNTEYLLVLIFIKQQDPDTSFHFSAVNKIYSNRFLHKRTATFEAVWDLTMCNFMRIFHGCNRRLLIGSLLLHNYSGINSIHPHASAVEMLKRFVGLWFDCTTGNQNDLVNLNRNNICTHWGSSESTVIHSTDVNAGICITKMEWYQGRTSPKL